MQTNLFDGSNPEQQRAETVKPPEGEPDPQMRSDLIASSASAPGSIHGLVTLVRRVSDHLFPGRTDQAMFLKMYSEIGELVDAPDSPDELADIFILLLDYAARKDINIGLAVTIKLQVLLNRQWEQRNGVYSHVR